MKCSTCPHYAAIERGEYNSKPWEEIPCAKCDLGEDTFYSVPFDEDDFLPGGEPRSPLVSEYSSFSSNPPKDSLAGFLPVPVINSIIKGLLSLAPELRDIVAWRYQGVPYKEIAQRQGSSTQLAEMRHKRAIREWPVLAELFPEKVAKQARRKARK